MTNYHRADRRTQWFEDNFPGSVMTPNALVLHTTEGLSWPGYAGGAIAPNYTAMPDFKAKRLRWRAHFPDERSARALENHPGGVETNTLNVVQVELVGTCDPRHAKRWGLRRAGRSYIYWPDAPAWALRDLAEFIADQNQRHGTKLVAPKPFKAYPGSYGASNGVRMTDHEWLNFYGVCGHQHVPENVHGDPGDLPIDHALLLAKGIVAPAPAPAPAPVPAPAPPAGTTPDPAPAKRHHPSRVERFLMDSTHSYDMALLDAAVAHGRTGKVKKVRDGIAHEVHRLPHDHNPHSLVNRCRHAFNHDRVLDLHLLDRAVAGGRQGTVKHVRDAIVALIDTLPTP